MKTQHKRQAFGSQQDTPTWLFATLVVAALASIRLLAGLEGFAAIGGLFVYIALIGVAASLWGADSRDGQVHL